MKIGIMQPYFLPYIGYWQLINAVDKYVIYDDVNFIKGGWINRNRILFNGEPKYFNIPMLGASQNKLINNIYINDDKKLAIKSLKTIEQAYKKAPYYNVVYPIIEKILNSDKRILSEYIADSIYIICDYLDIHTDIIISSKIEKNNDLRAQDKIISICRLLGASEYYNAIGGKQLYSQRTFEENGIKLFFLQTNDIKYEQFENDFKNNLSILDVMMFNSKEQIKNMLRKYVLI